jgi:AraC-like DNA-binding protein
LAAVAPVAPVEQDLGRSVAHGIARELVMFLRRPGSPYHLQCRFTTELGSPPAAYVERVRIEAAQRPLTESDEPAEVIARRCGFGTDETLRRAFHRHARIAPSEYRSRFRSASETTAVEAL